MFCLLSPCLCLLLFNVFFFFVVTSCKTHNMKLRYLRRQLQKALKIDTNGGVVIRGIHATKCHYVGIPKRFGPMRSSFFCVSIFCQLLLRGPGFSLQNWHLCFLQIYFHQIILSLLDEPKQPNSPTFPAPTHNKKIMLSITSSSGSPTNINQS